MILEELTETNAILLDNSLQLEHKISDGLLSDECPFFSNVFILFGLVELFHLLLEGLEGCAIIDELEILNFIIISAV
jgi:hypothetical protein